MGEVEAESEGEDGWWLGGGGVGWKAGRKEGKAGISEDAR